MQLVLTSELLLEAYKQGLFPMAYNANSQYVHWICPELRGQLPIEDIHIPRRLKTTIRKYMKHPDFEVVINRDFKGVMQACAEPNDKRPETWINEPIIEAFTKLHEEGHAHSIETWYQGKLVGGLYGLKIGGAFFGESMFSRLKDTSKITLIHLCARLWTGNFKILDTQFVNDHLKQFGVFELSHKDYMTALRDVINTEADFILTGQAQNDLMANFLAHRARKNI